MNSKRMATLVAAWVLLVLVSALPDGALAQQAAPATPPAREWTPERLAEMLRLAAERRQATERMVEEAKKLLREAGQRPSPDAAAVQPSEPGSVATGGPAVSLPAPISLSPFARRTSDWFDRPLDVRLRLGGLYATTERSDKVRSGGEKLALHRRTGKTGTWELALPTGDRDIVTLSGEGRRETIRPDATGREAGPDYRQLWTVAGLNWEHFCVRSQRGFTSLSLGAIDRFQDGKDGRPDVDTGEFQGEIRFGRVFGGGTLSTELRGGYTHTTDGYNGPTAAAILGLHGVRWDLEASARWSRVANRLGSDDKTTQTNQFAQLALRWHFSRRWDLTLGGGVRMADQDDDRNTSFTQRETGEFYLLQLGRRF